MQRHSPVSIDSWMPSAEARTEKSLMFWLIWLNGTRVNMSLWSLLQKLWSLLRKLGT